MSDFIKQVGENTKTTANYRPVLPAAKYKLLIEILLFGSLKPPIKTIIVRTKLTSRLLGAVT